MRTAVVLVARAQRASAASRGSGRGSIRCGARGATGGGGAPGAARPRRACPRRRPTLPGLRGSAAPRPSPAGRCAGSGPRRRDAAARCARPRRSARSRRPPWPLRRPRGREAPPLVPPLEAQGSRGAASHRTGTTGAPSGAARSPRPSCPCPSCPWPARAAACSPATERG